jgi:hypothetical protein
MPSLAISRIHFFTSLETSGLLFKTRETVVAESFAALAMSMTQAVIPDSTSDIKNLLMSYLALKLPASGFLSITTALLLK